MRRTCVVFSAALALSCVHVTHARVDPPESVPQAAPENTTENAPSTTRSQRPAATASTQAAPASVRAQDNPRALAEASLRRLSIPSPIEPAAWTALIAAVDPSHIDRPELKDAYSNYRATMLRLEDDPGRRIRQLLPAAYSFESARGTFLARPSPELVETLRLREKAILTADDATRTLFRALEAATPLERRGALSFERVALLRNAARRDGLLASTSACLGDILPKLRLDADMLAATSGVITPYAANLVRLLEARDRVLRNADAERARIESQAGTLWRLGNRERVAATEALLAGVDDQEFASEIAIRTLHSETLRKLRSILPRRAGRQLVEEWQHVVHPELFDDERILAELVEHVVEIPQLNSDTDTAAVDVLDGAYARLEPLAEAACAAADQMTPRLMEQTQSAALRVVEANLALLNAQQKRRAVLRDTLSRLRGIAGGAPLESLRKFDDLSETMAALERADGHDRVSLEVLAAELGIAIEVGDDEIKSDVQNGLAPRNGSGSPPNRPNPPAENAGSSGGSTRGSQRDSARGSRGSRGAPSSS